MTERIPQVAIETGAERGLESEWNEYLALERELSLVNEKSFALYGFAMEGGTELTQAMGIEKVAEAIKGMDVGFTVWDLIATLEPERSKRQDLYDMMDFLVAQSRAALDEAREHVNPDADEETDSEGYRLWQSMNIESLLATTGNAGRSRKHSVASYRLADLLPDVGALSRPIKRKIIGPKSAFDTRLPVDALESSGGVENAAWELHLEQQRLWKELHERTEALKRSAEEVKRNAEAEIMERYQEERAEMLADLKDLFAPDTLAPGSADAEMLPATLEKLSVDLIRSRNEEDAELRDARKLPDEVLDTLAKSRPY